MAEQVRTNPARRAKREAPEVSEKGAEQRAEAEKVKADADALIDEIDALLEEQGIGDETAAEQFVAGYRQYGGE